MWIIILLIILPIVGGTILCFSHFYKIQFTISYICAVIISILTSLVSFFVWFQLQNILFYDQKQFIYICKNIYLTFGVDSYSIYFIILSNVLLTICIWSTVLKITKLHEEYLLCLLLLQGCLNGFFLSTDLLFFFVMFESTLVPIYLIIGIWGTRERRIYAGYQFFLYTLVGSIAMLLSILALKIYTGTTSYLVLNWFDWGTITKIQLFIWVGLFLGFAIKIPMIPVHLWLPEAHVEAPTGGSIILAGILLKLGGYGFIKILFPFFYYSCFFFGPIVQTIALLSIVYASFATLRQIDLKKIIAYTSIAHMNLAVVGLFAFNEYAFYGGIYLMLAHGITSSALFFCIGVLYAQSQTRLLIYFRGLALTMPLFTFYFFLFSISNFSFPGSGNFVGELLIMIGLCEVNFILALIAGVGFILSAIYTMWVYNRTCFGLDTQYINYYQTSTTIKYTPLLLDLEATELHTVNLFLFLNVVLGLFPNLIFIF